MLRDTKAECYFLDVGQGASHIITLGQGRAIVIDAGPADKYKILLQVLGKLQIHTLEAVVFSHNDEDHIGNATNLLLTYPKHINRLYFIRDRDVHKTSYYKHLVKCVCEMKKEGNLHKVVDLSDVHNQAETILFNDKVNTETGIIDIVLKQLYPLELCNALQAQLNNAPNDTCAVLLLTVGESQIVFAGDAPYKAWMQMQANGLSFPIEAGVATVPHHGGLLSDDDKKEEGEKAFYAKVLCPKIGIVSVGTTNTHKHPLPENISRIVKSGIGDNLICTEMTSQCTDISSWKQNPLRFRPHELSRSALDKKCLPCSGTVVVDIAPQEMEIKHYEKVQLWKTKHLNRLCRSQ